MPEENVQIPKFSVVSLYLSETHKAPVDGESIYIVLSQTDKQVTVLHPFTLTKFTIPALVFQQALMSLKNQPKAETIVKLLQSRLAQDKKAPRVDTNAVIEHYSRIIS